MGYDVYQMIKGSMERGAFYKGVTKGVLSLIPKEGDDTILNYWRPITLLTIIYKVFNKTLERYKEGYNQC